MALTRNVRLERRQQISDEACTLGFGQLQGLVMYPA